MKKSWKIIFPIFHIAIPLIITEIKFIKQLKINRFYLLIGSILPDIIDKPIAIFGLGSGRSFSHNIFFILISFLLLFFISKRNLNISLSFLLGLIFHILLDLPYIPLFYPFIPYDSIIIDDPLSYYVQKILTDPVVIITELTGIVILIIIVFRNKLYDFQKIIIYFKGEPQEFHHSSYSK